MTDEYIEANYYPEDSSECSYVRLMFNGEKYASDPVKGFEHEYPSMAFRGLKQTLQELREGEIKKPPAQRLVMWY